MRKNGSTVKRTVLGKEVNTRSSNHLSFFIFLSSLAPQEPLEKKKEENGR